jgi:hypothetical protein
MRSNWFNGIEILQGRRQHGEKVGYCYPSGLEKTLRKWGIYRVYQNEWSGLEVDYIYKYGEETYKYY